MKPKIQIVFYTNIIPPYRFALFNAMSRSVNLIVNSASQSEAFRGWSDNNVTRNFKLVEHHLPRILFQNSFFYLPKISWLRKIDCDLMIIGGWEHPANMLLILLSVLRNQKFLIFYESTKKDGKYSKFTLVRYIKRLVFRASSGVITVGRESTLNVINLGISTSRIFQGFNAIDADWWASKNELRVKTSPDRGVRFLFVGQLIERKRIDTLIRSFARMSTDSDSLTIVGNGALENQLKRLTLELATKNRIEFKPAVNNEELRNIYLNHDVLVLPSKYEVWGMVALEALACGLSVILSVECGVSSELVHLRNVSIFENESELEKAISLGHQMEFDPNVYEFFQINSMNNFAQLIIDIATSNRMVSRDQ